jgi:ferredoxin
MPHDVHFESAGRTVPAEEGEVLLDVAKQAGVHIDSTCGGNGSCHQCRVTLDAPENFQDEQGRPVAPRHKQGDAPVYLACRGRVAGGLRVNPAPVHALGARPRDPGLTGWHVNPPGKPARVIDLGSATGAVWEVSADGDFERATPFSLEDPDGGIPEPGEDLCVRVGRDVPRAEALALGVAHLGADMTLIFDLAGFVAVVRGGEARCEPVPTMALLGDAPHLPGAIDSVEWSPLKTRTVLTTVDNAEPLGLCASGVLACIAAIRQAGMCDADWQLNDSRFTRDGREALLVGPDTEAVTPGGAILTAAHDIVFTQQHLDDARHALHGLRLMAEHLCAGDMPDAVVFTGEYGTYATTETLAALELWPETPKPQPHLAALGAARAINR